MFGGEFGESLKVLNTGSGKPRGYRGFPMWKLSYSLQAVEDENWGKVS